MQLYTASTAALPPANLANSDGVVIEPALIDASANDITLNLPAPTRGSRITLKRVDNAATTVTVTPTTGQIDGNASVTISALGSLRLLGDGTNWWEI